MTILLRSYRLLMRFSAPLLKMWLARRQGRGKEDPARLAERWGQAAMARPGGTLLWCHAASVGEAQSALPLLSAITGRWPDVNILMTTGSRTSAELMAVRLPQGMIHQYAPLDHPAWVARFLDHWRPDLALWLESEFWPNCLTALQQRQCPTLLLNARLSARSFRRWQRFPQTAAALLATFDICLAQSTGDQEQLRKLGSTTVQCLGNLKHAAPDLPVDMADFRDFQRALAGRPYWLAASLHNGEDEIILQAHRQLAARFAGLVTILAPRHPERGPAIAEAAQQVGLQAVLRSAGVGIEKDCEFYIADSIGELGLFYRLSAITFIGGSCVPQGGHNPLEPARLQSAILFGPHMENHKDAAAQLQAAGAAIEVKDAGALATAVEAWMADPAACQQAQQAAIKAVVGKEEAILNAFLDVLQPYLPPAEARHARA